MPFSDPDMGCDRRHIGGLGQVSINIAAGPFDYIAGFGRRSGRAGRRGGEGCQQAHGQGAQNLACGPRSGDLMTMHGERPQQRQEMQRRGREASAGEKGSEGCFWVVLGLGKIGDGFNPERDEDEFEIAGWTGDLVGDPRYGAKRQATAQVQSFTAMAIDTRASSDQAQFVIANMPMAMIGAMLVKAAPGSAA